MATKGFYFVRSIYCRRKQICSCYISPVGCHFLIGKCNLCNSFMRFACLWFKICLFYVIIDCTCCCCCIASVVSDSVRPHRWQPTRLPRPWDSPGKNTGVGCHFLLQCMKVKSENEVAQSCLTLRDPMDCSLPGSSAHEIFQARVLEWGAIAFSMTIHRFQKIRKKHECHENSYYESPQQKYREKQNQRLRKECLREDLLWFLVVFLLIFQTFLRFNYTSCFGDLWGIPQFYNNFLFLSHGLVRKPLFKGENITFFFHFTIISRILAISRVLCSVKNMNKWTRQMWCGSHKLKDLI